MPLVRRFAPVLVLALLVSLAFASGAAAAKRSVPHGFMGVVVNEPLSKSGALFDSESRKMVAAGVESVRVPFDWRLMQPFRSPDAVPADRRSEFRTERGVPTRWAHSDRAVRIAARRGLRLLPVVVTSPAWAARRDHLASPPEGTATYAAFVGTLVERYGPNGTFWRENPSLRRAPLREWQIWNEPTHPGFWSDQPWVEDYVALARAARAEVRRLDPRGRTIAAGFVGPSWESLEAMMKVPGAKTAFDAVAIHPYTRNILGVLDMLRLCRQALDRAGLKRMPMYATEVTWPSSKGRAERFGFEMTEAEQARQLKGGIRVLARERRWLRLTRVYWFTWLTHDESTVDPFDYSGLRKLMPSGAVRTKPAFTSYLTVARSLEGCRKGALATRCR